MTSLTKNLQLPTKKVFFIANYVCLFISRNHLLQQFLILHFLHGTVTENAVFACLHELINY